MRSDDRGPYAYLRARAADADGDLMVAAHGYATALAVVPGDPELAGRAYREAVNAGDRALASRMAPLALAGAKPLVDARLLILADAVEARDWTAAHGAVDAIGKDGVFNLLVPVLNAWIAAGEGSGDPVALLRTANGGLAAALVPEHRVYLLLLAGRYDDGIGAARALGETPDAVRVRIGAAGILAEKGEKERALALLAGTARPLVRARAIVAGGHPLGEAVTTPARGIAQLLLRLGLEISQAKRVPLALSLSRISTFLAPDGAPGWLVTADLLGDAGQYAPALAALGNVAADDPYADTANGVRIGLLAGAGDAAGALAAARTLAERPDAGAGDWLRLGDQLVEGGRQRDAAGAYARAAALTPAGDGQWQALLLQGSALERGGDWPAARGVLQRAAALAPNEASVLNYLGYAQLARRENMAGAAAMIARASQLKPDDAAITDSLGWALFLRGETDRGIATLERASRASPGEPTINEHLGDAYWSVGRRYEARYAWRAALVQAEAADAKRIEQKLAGGLTPQVAAP